MLGVRWYKVINDSLSNKTRTVLIVLSIAVGLFAIGTIVNARVILSQDLAEGYAGDCAVQRRDPHDSDFDEDLVRSVAPDERRARGGRPDAPFGALPGQAKRRPRGRRGHCLALARSAIVCCPRLCQMRVNKIRPQAGAWPPPSTKSLSSDPAWS